MLKRTNKPAQSPPRDRIRNRRARAPVEAEYARAVINLYHHVIDKKPIDKSIKLTAQDRRDANAMACALVFIRQVADEHTKNCHPFQYVESGLAQAYELLAVL